MQRASALAVCLLCAASLVVAASPPSEDLQIRVEGEGNRVRSSLREGTTLLAVHSPSGLGRARIERPSGAFSGPLRLQLWLAGLEELRLEYADVSVVVSLPSEAGAPPRQSARAGGAGDEQPIGADSPFWLALERPAPGLIELEFPRDFSERRVRSFAIAWVDFFR